MFQTRTICLSLAACSAAFLALPASAISFSKEKDASVKVQRGGPLKGKTTFAIGAFRVAFVTEDAANSESHGMFAGSGSAARMTGELVGLDHATMQKIADGIYANFLKQSAAKGYTVIESGKLADMSAAYKELGAAENFASGRLGTFVIPTAQRSVILAGDTSAKQEKGSAGMGAAFHNIGKQMAKADANKAFPEASKQVGAPVVGVTIVVNFANFKGSSSSFGNSKASFQAGATIDGQIKTDILPSTSILAWDGKTAECALCMAEVILEGQIHSEEKIGAVESHSEMKAGDRIANGIASLGGTAQMNKRGASVTVDPVAYEKSVLIVAANASDLLLSGMAKER